MKETIPIRGLQRESKVIIGESLGSLSNYLPNARVFVITDQHIQSLYGHHWKDFPYYVLEPGEQSKMPEIAVDIYRWLIRHQADRSAFIIGIGGGMVCDMAGFIASTYLRGIDFGFVATSLLAQVDASIGGKNGVNIDGYKNLVGTFNQPCFVICDTSLIKTLPTEELRNGLAEVVKHALIADTYMFEFIENNTDNILHLKETAIQYLVSRSVHIKASVVEQDERESGQRRVLNLGHTWGHAVEKTDAIPHGQAVSIGLVFAAGLSIAKSYLKKQERDRLVRLLTDLGLPVETHSPHNVIFEALLKDKKKQEGIMHFVLMNGIGRVVVEPIPIHEIRDYLKI